MKQAFESYDLDERYKIIDEATHTGIEYLTPIVPDFASDEDLPWHNDPQVTLGMVVSALGYYKIDVSEEYYQRILWIYEAWPSQHDDLDELIAYHDSRKDLTTELT